MDNSGSDRVVHCRVEAPTTFEVSASGTLTMAGVNEPAINADLYDVNTDRLGSAFEITIQIADVPPLLDLIRSRISSAVEDFEQDLQDVCEDDADLPDDDFDERMSELEVLREIAEDEAEGWSTWLDRLDAPELAECVKEIRAWLQEPIDWRMQDDSPMDRGPQGAALHYFEDLDEDVLDALGIKLVYGDSPGSSYYAAELEGDIGTANQVALAAGLNLKFLPEIDAKSVDAAGCQSTGLDQCAEPAREPTLIELLSGRFRPAFGHGVGQAERHVGQSVDAHTVPPPALRGVHNAEVLGQAWQRMLAILRDPVEVWTDAEGARHLGLLGTGVYSIGLDGRLSVHLWEVNGDGEVALETIAEDEICAWPMPLGWRWLDRLERAFAAELAKVPGNMGISVPTLTAYASWAFKLFRARIRSNCDMRWVRARIAMAVGLDPLAIDIGRRVNVLRPQSWVVASTYNRAVKHLDAQLKLVRDAPRLAPLFHILCEAQGFPAEGEPLERLATYLRAQGLSQRCWRMVVKSGSPLLRPVAEFYSRQGPEAVVDYLGLCDRLQWRQEPSAAFMASVLALRGHAARRLASYADNYEPQLPVLKRVVAWFEGRDAAQRQAILEGLAAVLNWLDLAGAAGACQQQHLSWQWLMRRAKEWEEKRAALANQGDGRWPVPTLPESIGEFDVRMIRSPAELLDEGRAMRHCIFDFLARCEAGTNLVASIRKKSDGRRVATVMFIATGTGWRLSQAVGFANRTPSPSVTSAIGSLATASWTRLY